MKGAIIYEYSLRIIFYCLLRAEHQYNADASAVYSNKFMMGKRTNFLILNEQNKIKIVNQNIGDFCFVIFLAASIIFFLHPKNNQTAEKVYFIHHAILSM